MQNIKDYKTLLFSHTFNMHYLTMPFISSTITITNNSDPTNGTTNTTTNVIPVALIFSQTAQANITVH